MDRRGRAQETDLVHQGETALLGFIYRSIDLAAELAANARAVEAVAGAIKLLDEPLPDTFLGRKRKYFIAMPDDAMPSQKPRITARTF